VPRVLLKLEFNAIKRMILGHRGTMGCRRVCVCVGGGRDKKEGKKERKEKREKSSMIRIDEELLRSAIIYTH
jgi:hypothetical protein